MKKYLILLFVSVFSIFSNAQSYYMHEIAEEKDFSLFDSDIPFIIQFIIFAIAGLMLFAISERWLIKILGILLTAFSIFVVYVLIRA